MTAAEYQRLLNLTAALRQVGDALAREQTLRGELYAEAARSHERSGNALGLAGALMDRAEAFLRDVEAALTRDGAAPEAR